MSDILSKAVHVALGERDRESRTQRFFDRPDLWAEYMLGVNFWSKQKEIALDVMENRNVAVKAGHGVGKSFLVACLIAHWVDTRYPNAFVASTAPSTAQIGAIVWREIRRMYAQIEKRFEAGLIDHKLPGKINADAKNNEWKDKSGQLIGFGRKPPEGKEDDNFQGIHDGYVLAVGDEAVGLSPEMIDALGNITSNPNSRRIIIANPTNPASYMGKIFKEDTGAWKLHTISVFDSPNFTDERHTMSQEALDRLTGPEYVEDKKKEYGESSARYKARVLGEFAFDNTNSLISQDDITPALNAEITPSTETRPELGVDVARFGDDVTVVYSYHDGLLRYLDSWSKAPTTETANRVHRLAIDTAAKVVKIDAGGVGGGVVDQVSQMSGNSYTVVGLNSSGASPDKKQWHNVRAFWWDDFRSRCRKGEISIDVQEQKAETLQDELMAPQYKYGNTGGLLIESKDEMRKRGMKSPDFADAAIFAAADVSFLTGDPINELEPGSHVLVDMDQFSDQVDFLGCW